MSDLVANLQAIADASRRQDGSGIPLGQQLRKAADEIEALSAALSVQPAAAVVGEPVAAYHVKVKGWGEELCFTEDGAQSLVTRLRRTKGQDGEATITPLYATLPNEALERSEQATFDIAARLLKERDALAARISQQDAELERLRREVEEARKYAENLAVVLHEKYHYDNKQWKPLSGDLIGLLTQIDNKPLSGDLIGLLTQIDNMTVGLVHRAEARKAAFIEAAEMATATGTDAENDWPGETWIAYRIAEALRAKAEETTR